MSRDKKWWRKSSQVATTTYLRNLPETLPMRWKFTTISGYKRINQKTIGVLLVIFVFRQTCSIFYYFWYSAFNSILFSVSFYFFFIYNFSFFFLIMDVFFYLVVVVVMLFAIYPIFEFKKKNNFMINDDWMFTCEFSFTNKSLVST